MFENLSLTFKAVLSFQQKIKQDLSSITKPSFSLALNAQFWHEFNLQDEYMVLQIQ